MQNLPPASTYDEEVTYMPWGVLISQIEELITSSVPQGGAVLDLFCGTGNLMGRLHSRRPDVFYTGVDLEKEYIEFAHASYPSLNFEVGDALVWSSDKLYDAVVVTGGLHHLPYEKHEIFVQKVGSLLKTGGVAIIADPYVDRYTNEAERKLAAAKLGYEYLVATISNGATDAVTKAAADLIVNDVLGVEFKTSIKRIKPIFDIYFTHVEEYKTWPKGNSEYGDYYFLLRK